MENSSKPIVISIAGFDTSAGAGTLADIKTFENTGTYGIAVITAYTLQTEHLFEKISWRKNSHIIHEITFLFSHYPISFAKIGITKNIQMLTDIVNTLRACNSKIKIIWDPVLYSSTGKKIFHRKNLSDTYKIIDKIYCITPNYEEALTLSQTDSLIDAGMFLAKYTNVIIKGGHHSTNKGTDYLFKHNCKTPIEIPPQSSQPIYPKHGSGCVFSSAITSYLALNYSLKQSALLAKKYTEKFLSSHPSLLGYHHNFDT
ncbi:MAG: hydroxymethylpyrimidine/phosphomethylpyrimidine kinase [Bacteroidia bacterium]